jgi:hypothetical protein
LGDEKQHVHRRRNTGSSFFQYFIQYGVKEFLALAFDVGDVVKCLPKLFVFDLSGLHAVTVFRLAAASNAPNMNKRQNGLTFVGSLFARLWARV